MIIGDKSWKQALSNPLQRLPYITVKAKHAIQTTTTSVRQAASSLKSSAKTWSKRIVSLIVLEVLLILLLHLYVIPAVPIWFMIIPLLALDYVAVALLVLYLKIKVCFITIIPFKGTLIYSLLYLYYLLYHSQRKYFFFDVTLFNTSLITFKLYFKTFIFP